MTTALARNADSGMPEAMVGMPNVLVWDLETIPDLQGFAAAHGHEGKTDDEIRGVLGEKFPKHIFHSIVCIGALIAHQETMIGWSMPLVPLTLASDPNGN